jgi:hypothetical protein
VVERTTNVEAESMNRRRNRRNTLVAAVATVALLATAITPAFANPR